mmetsp:Transcript_38771/g.90634  ORF Transcript_38771/g.90634 Transcript_38771/m.90634 type:complete len:250 (+) Transcript_38771:269-1018(+)
MEVPVGALPVEHVPPCHAAHSPADAHVPVDVAMVLERVQIEQVGEDVARGPRHQIARVERRDPPRARGKTGEGEEGVHVAHWHDVGVEELYRVIHCELPRVEFGGDGAREVERPDQCLCVAHTDATHTEHARVLLGQRGERLPVGDDDHRDEIGSRAKPAEPSRCNCHVVHVATVRALYADARDHRRIRVPGAIPSPAVTGSAERQRGAIIRHTVPPIALTAVVRAGPRGWVRIAIQVALHLNMLGLVQ